MTAEVDDEARRHSYGSPRTSDPSELTTAQTLREVGALKELVFIEIAAIKESIKVAHEDSERVPTDIQQAVTQLEQVRGAKIEAIYERFNNVAKTFEVHLEKFVGINNRFEQLDKRLDKSAADATVALASALQAAKELVSVQNANTSASILKSDTSTDKKLEGQGAAINTMRDGFNTSLNEIKNRVDRWESAAAGRAEQQTTTRESTKDSRDSTSLWVAIGGLVLGIVLGALGIIIAK